jgi:hypothetical protein
MEVSGKLHTPAVLHTAKTAVLIEQEAGWAPEAIWTFWITEMSVAPLQGFEPWTFHSVT